MAANKVRADYEVLAEISAGFECQARNIRRTLGRLHQDLDVLLEGDWVGRGATDFYREMISEVLPSVKRLGDALEQAARVTREMSRIMKQAEDASARLFTVDWAAQVHRHAREGGPASGSWPPDLPGPVDDWFRRFFQSMADRLGLKLDLDGRGAPSAGAALPPPAVTIVEATPTPGATAAAPAGTPAPSATPTPGAVPTRAGTMYVSSPMGANLRSEPGTDNIPRGLLAPGTAVEVIGGPTGEINGHTWYQVNASGETGWVAGTVLSGEAPGIETNPVVSSLTDAVKAISPLNNPSSVGGNLYGESEYYDDNSFKGLHPGIDISSNDTTVKANTNGTVYFYQTWKDAESKWHTEPYNDATAKSSSEFDKGDGFANYAVLETDINGTKYYQVFAHLDSFDSGLTQGQQVTAGTVLGTMGCTGSCDGAHVHWEIRRDEAVDQANNHSFGSMWYPQNENELQKYFVDPVEFANVLNPSP